VRDSSEKPATCVASEDLQRIARPEALAQGHAHKIQKLNKNSMLSIKVQSSN